jgi:hypothetical protein
MIIGGVQGFDIARPRRAGSAQTLPSPRKPRTPELHRQEIGQQAGVAAVAVRERVNLHKPVMEAQRDFIGWIVWYSIHALVSSSNWRWSGISRPSAIRRRVSAGAGL